MKWNPQPILMGPLRGSLKNTLLHRLSSLDRSSYEIFSLHKIKTPGNARLLRFLI
jgi:hypothetical protein